MHERLPLCNGVSVDAVDGRTGVRKPTFKDQPSVQTIFCIKGTSGNYFSKLKALI